MISSETDDHEWYLGGWVNLFLHIFHVLYEETSASSHRLSVTCSVCFGNTSSQEQRKSQGKNTADLVAAAYP